MAEQAAYLLAHKNTARLVRWHSMGRLIMSVQSRLTVGSESRSNKTAEPLGSQP
jgi:hypothetical protein